MYMTYVFDKLLHHFVDEKMRGIALKGGSRSSKTWSTLQLLYLVAIESEEPILISCVTTDLPAVRRGMFRDFKNMLLAEGAWDENKLNKTELIYEVKQGCYIEFFGCDNAGKVHGPARDILFINEAQKVPREIFRQLDIRTTMKVIIDFNPVKRFWGETDFVGDEYVILHSTYKDNPYLTDAQVQAIERNRNDENWWRVYGEGETGGTEGLVYPEYEVVESVDWDDTAIRWVYGLDFGFVNDPTAIVKVGFKDWNLYLQEVTYETGLLNRQIRDRLSKEWAMKNHKTVVCDNAEQKSIVELRQMGINSMPCIKGKGSIKAGISQVKQFKIHATKDSINLLNELDLYSFVKDDLNGTYTSDPVDQDNHALDAVRYATDYLIRRYKPGARKDE